MVRLVKWVELGAVHKRADKLGPCLKEVEKWESRGCGLNDMLLLPIVTILAG